MTGLPGPPGLPGLSIGAPVPAVCGAIPAVSVVIPAYNRADTIRVAVESVLGQSFRDLELIVVDDASTDATARVLAGIGDPRMRVIVHDRNQGGSAARNTGLAAARAPITAFQDSDDEWLPRKLDHQLARLGEGDVGVYCGMVILGTPDTATPGGRPVIRYVPDPARPLAEGAMLERLLEESLISTQTLLARTQALRAAGGFDPALKALQDWDAVLRLARLGPIACVDEPLVIQRFSANSLTRSSRNRVLARVRVVEKNLDLLAARPRLLARHYHAIAGGYRQLGQGAEARSYLARALRLDPWRGASWAAFARTLLARSAPAP